MLMSRSLQVRLVQFYICLLQPTSNCCINSVLGYECYQLGIGGMNNLSNPVNLALSKSQQGTSISNKIINHRHVFRIQSRHASNCILLGQAVLFHPRLEFHPTWPHSGSLPCFPVILLHFVPYLPLYTALCIPNFTSSNMEPTASQASNHYYQNNQEAHPGRALAWAFKKTADLHCQSNVWTSNPACKDSVGDS